MPNKYLLLIAVASAAAMSAVAAVFVVRRSRTELPPVSPTVPRVDNLGSADGIVNQGTAGGDVAL
ncbi:hypothetical protein EF294_06195 [Gordonia oryzae]|uniref:DUF2613 family protein n=1 Tax=Gordonia oryzae TaxID=2487349 RepID=A0A3N4GTE3_9ACTN|nr:hypothetical protein [Gordonia oryzae]RPA64717.1 hypothetical protein EF294_06195 [Gordonia oryzae]